MKTTTKIKAGGIGTQNHTQRLSVKSAVKAGGVAVPDRKGK